MSTQNTPIPLRVPQSLNLLPFQVSTCEQAMRFINANSTHSCYIANEPGLGKTICATVIVNTLQCTRNIVLCPKSMVLVWEQEVLKWSRFSLNGIPKVSAILHEYDIEESSQANWIIISYGMLLNKRIQEVLFKQTFDALIADEFHYTKNPKAKRSKATFKLWDKCTYRIAMSGTPFLNGIDECYGAFHAILPQAFPSEQAFLSRYAIVEQTTFKVYPKGRPPFLMTKDKVTGLKNAEELSKIIRSSFYIRYKKEQVLTDLPPITHQKIILPEEYSVIPKTHEQEIALERQNLLQAIEENKTLPQTPHLSISRQDQGLAIVPEVVEFAVDLLDQNIPILVFAYHHSVIDALASQLSAYEPVVLTGQTSSQDRQLAIDNFQNESTNLFIGQLTAAGQGITLTRATHIILAEFSWVPAENVQACSRAHRIGTKGNVTAYWFMVRGSIHEQILEAVLRKTQNFKAVLD